MDATMSAKAWTKEELEVASDLAAKGMTASEIGKSIGRTRNSVIGAMHRNSVKLLNKKEKKPEKERRPRPVRTSRLKSLFSTGPKLKAEKYDEPPPPPNPEKYVRFLDRRYNECKFIVEKRGDTYYCCGAEATRSGWCEYHASIVFRPVDPKPVKKDGGYGVHPALRGFTNRIL